MFSLAQSGVTGPTPQSWLQAELGLNWTPHLCSGALCCIAWDISVSSPCVQTRPVGIWCLGGEWFYTSHSTRKQHLFESCVTGFPRISSVLESTCSPCPQQLPLRFPICRFLCATQSTGQRDLPLGDLVPWVWNGPAGALPLTLGPVSPRELLPHSGF